MKERQSLTEGAETFRRTVAQEQFRLMDSDEAITEYLASGALDSSTVTSRPAELPLAKELVPLTNPDDFINNEDFISNFFGAD